MMKKVIAVCLALVFALSCLASCTAGIDKDNEDDNKGSANNTTVLSGSETVTDIIPYEYPEVNYNNETFTILNSEDKYNMIMNVTFDAISGDKVNDAIFANTTKIETQYQVVIEEKRLGWDDLLSLVKADTDGVYDVAYLRATNIASLMTIGALTNLYDYSDIMHFDQIWWDQTVIKDATLLNKYLFYASSDAHLMAIEGTWCIYFNMGMFDQLEIEYPYETVRSGAWTVSAMQNLAEQGVDSRGDTSFDWSIDGKCIYGLTSQKNFINALMTGCNEMYCLKDKDDKPYFAMGQSKTVADVLDRIFDLTSATKEGTYISVNNTSTGHYMIHVFAGERAMMAGGEIKSAATELKSMTSKYGMLPIPKYNKKQTDYINNMYWGSLFMVIPKTAKNPERTAIIMDTFSYLGYAKTLPEYYIQLSYKGLYDEDSVEMLSLIRDNRYFNWAIAYGWVSSIEPTINSDLDAGKRYSASVIAANTDKINEFIETTLKSLGE